VTAVADRPRSPQPGAAGGAQHRFGLSPAFSVGIEEELLLVDPATYELTPGDARLYASRWKGVGRVAKEIFAAEVELITPVCADVGEAAAVLTELRRRVRAAGATPLASGVHPAAPLGQVALNSGRRYRAVADALAGVLRAPTCALHVHVGLPDPETAIRVANGMRRHLPMLHALAANSPFWGGRDSGLASARAAILRAYPRTELPRAFYDWDDFCATAAELAFAAGVPDYSYFWWELRPHPLLGTVEIRAVDVQASIERTAAMAGLIHTLARMEADRHAPTLSREALAECCFQATRHGLEARLLDDDGVRVGACALVRQRLADVASYARELDADAALLGIDRILREGNGADRQRAAFRRGGLQEVLRQLGVETVGGEERVL
jgi:carboxylate-amine ligase